MQPMAGCLSLWRLPGAFSPTAGDRAVGTSLEQAWLSLERNDDVRSAPGLIRIPKASPTCDNAKQMPLTAVAFLMHWSEAVLIAT